MLDGHDEDGVPGSLRGWFWVRSVVDVGIGVPLLLVPELGLSRLGWTAVDPVASRLAGGLLIAFGWQCLRNLGGPRATYRALLGLEAIASAMTTLGMLIAIGAGAPAAAWAVLAFAIASSGVALHYLIRMRREDGGPAMHVPGDAVAAIEDIPAENDMTTEDLGPLGKPV